VKFPPTKEVNFNDINNIDLKCFIFSRECNQMLTRPEVKNLRLNRLLLCPHRGIKTSLIVFKQIELFSQKE
jgi:hypothetical protein